MLAVDLVRIEVGDGGAVVDPAQPRDGAGVEQELRNQRRFSGVVVADNGDVPDLRTRIDLHVGVSSLGDFTKGA